MDTSVYYRLRTADYSLSVRYWIILYTTPYRLQTKVPVTDAGYFPILLTTDNRLQSLCQILNTSLHCRHQTTVPLSDRCRIAAYHRGNRSLSTQGNEGLGHSVCCAKKILHTADHSTSRDVMSIYILFIIWWEGLAMICIPKHRVNTTDIKLLCFKGSELHVVIPYECLTKIIVHYEL